MLRTRLYIWTLIAFWLAAMLFPMPVPAQTDIADLPGTILAQYNDSSQGITNVVDHNPTTKYLTFHDSCWIQFSIAIPCILTKYSITSSNDYPAGDPKDWILQGSNDTLSWTTLDTESNQVFANRFQTNEYSITDTTPFRIYRLSMTNNGGKALQLSDWDLWMPSLAHDARVAKITVPRSIPDVGATPQVLVVNVGTNTESFPVTCSVDSEGIQVYHETQNVSSIAAGDSQTISFPTWTPGADGPYVMIAWSSLAGDLMPLNDTVSVVVPFLETTYIVPYAHLDLQWGWTEQNSIDTYIPNTMSENFALFQKYPGYCFNFEGAYRYMLMKQYYPSDYQTLKEYVAEGRWNPSGAMIEAVDVNMPSPEALIRQILYGNNFFQKEFGKMSADLLLPDCFGFPYTLPTIAAHCGLIGFSTQKFELWGGFRPTPFSIGIWEGVDGSRIIAALRPGAYNSTWEIRTDDINELGQTTGIYASYDYFGVGDQGGAPPESEVASLMTRIQQNPDSGVQVLCTPSDQLYKDLSGAQIARLSVYNGELLMTTHGTGCYTAHADQKRLNRLDELTADEAERSSVLSELYAANPYPLDRINQAWIQFLPHDFHDDLTGTSIQPAYDEFSTPDRVAALTTFTQIRDSANYEVAALLDTRVDDPTTMVPIVVYNPIAIDRHDPVDVTVTFPGSAPNAVSVFDSKGLEVPSQVKQISGSQVRVIFMADAPSVGYAVYQIKKADSSTATATGLAITTSQLENGRYLVKIDANGDISSMFDKKLNQELFAAPSRFELRNDQSANWPAWEVLYSDVTSSPRAYVDESVQKTIVDSGAAEVTLQVTRSKEGSTYIHDYTLTADSNGYCKVSNTVNWQPTSPSGSLLKVSFTLTASNPVTTYDLGLGTIGRGVDTPDLYEVPAHQWADISNADGSYGTAILNDCKYGWDKPTDNKIQLTLIHTPNSTNWYYGGDRYTHTFSYAIYGHRGTWADGSVVSAAQRLNQPLVAFQTPSHSGALGKDFWLLMVDPSQLAVMAVKKAESGDGYIVRVREVSGKSWSASSIAVNAHILSAQEVNGMEAEKGPVSYSDSILSFAIGPYQLRTFEMQLSDPYPTGSVTPHSPSARSFALLPAYPNPANPTINIVFQLPENESVTIKVYNVLGQLVRTLLNNAPFHAGQTTWQWDGDDDRYQQVPSGVYLVRVSTPKHLATQKIVIVK